METLNCSMLEVLIGPFDVQMDMVAAKASTMRRSDVKDDDDDVPDHPVHTPGMMKLRSILGGS